MDDNQSHSELTQEDLPLEERIFSSSKGKTGLVDTFSNITYSTVVGAGIDALAGLNFWGIVSARIASLGSNVVTAAPYGLWTEFLYKKTRISKESGFLRKRAVDTLAFITFQVPVYAGVVSIGSLVSEGQIDFKKVKEGATYLCYASPFIGPTLGWYMDFCRKLFGVKSVAEGSYLSRTDTDTIAS